MKKILFILIIFSIALNAKAQSTYAEAIELGDNNLKKGKFKEAMNYYFAAEAFEPAKKSIVKEKINKVFNEINQLKDKAQKAEKTANEAVKQALLAKKNADIATEKAEIEKEKAQKALAKAEEMQKLMETAIFDKAVKERNKKWKGWNRYHIFLTDINKYFIDSDRDLIIKTIDSLDLSDNMLFKIPKEVTECPNLKYINLLGNNDINWKESKEVLSKLNEEVEISVSVNDLSDIDSTYWHLITSIDISQHDLTIIPENILAQRQLTYLDLGGNNINTLPSEIGKLTNLTKLDLWGNQLSTLSPEVGKLTNLIKLNLAGNQLTNLPSEIGNMTNLTYLNLRKNKLTVLPIEISKLINLKKLV